MLIHTRCTRMHVWDLKTAPRESAPAPFCHISADMQSGMPSMYMLAVVRLAVALWYNPASHNAHMV
jgi:hypothetical protein